MTEILEAFKSDGLTLAIMLGILATGWLANTLAGSYAAIIDGTFEWKKFLTGLGKGALLGVCVCLLFTCCELLPFALGRLSGVVTIDTEFVGTVLTVGEVFGLLVVAIKKYIIEAFRKLCDIFGTSVNEIEDIISDPLETDDGNQEVI